MVAITTMKKPIIYQFTNRKTYKETSNQFDGILQTM